MDLKLTARQLEGAQVLEVQGEVDLSNSAQLRAELLRLSEAPEQCLVLDLSGVGFMDSSGIGVLVGAVNRKRTAGGNILLAAPQPRVRRVFEITGLVHGIPLHQSVDDALSFCRGQSGLARAS